MVFENTRSALFKIKSDVKRYLFVFTAVTQLLYIAYLAVALILPIGSRWISGVTLAVCLLYFMFFIAFERRGGVARTVRRGVKRAYKWTKLAIKAVSLSITVYGITVTLPSVATTSTVVLLIIQAFTVVLWVLQAVFELVKIFVTAEIELLSEAFSRDTDALKKPIEAVRHPLKTAGGFLGRVFGRGSAEEQTPESAAERRRGRRLDGAIADFRQYREEKRHSKKQEKKSKSKAKESTDTTSDGLDAVHK